MLLDANILRVLSFLEELFAATRGWLGPCPPSHQRPSQRVAPGPRSNEGLSSSVRKRKHSVALLGSGSASCRCEGVGTLVQTCLLPARGGGSTQVPK